MLRSSLKQAAIWAVSFLVLQGVAWGAISYDEGVKAIRICDFPKDMPCTLKRLAEVNGLFGWNKVTYDKASDTYTVTGDLWIGNNDDTETYFQIGGKEHPGETLIMKGNIFVRPYWKRGQNEGKHWWYVPKKVNRLTLGVQGDETVKAALKFDCNPQNHFALFTGLLIEADGKVIMPNEAWGGQLFVYNSLITAVTQKPGYEVGSAIRPLPRGALLLYGNGNVLDNAEISWVKGYVGYGRTCHAWKRDSCEYSIVNTVFSHCGYVCASVEKMAGCKFVDCVSPVQDAGDADVEFTDCVFSRNTHNFTLKWTGTGVTCIDCEIGAPLKGDSYVAKRAEKGQFPKFISKRHVVVEVADAAGKPVTGAEVTVKAEQPGAGMLENIRHVTGKDGKTDGKAGKNPILLTGVIKTATITQDQPEVQTFSYTVTASHDGKTAALKGVKPDKSWEVVRIVLK